ncbi:putative leucine-rich repeat domain superfamily [Helianthus annuus]|nr:putative leucine-rich repeat domain superfamily [Helianthus annuus]
MFPCLQELQIKKCPNLSDVSLEALPSLRVLKIDGCCESGLRSLVRAAWAVEELSIFRCNEIRYLWESEAKASKVLVNLKKLQVYCCKNLVSLGEKEEDEDNIRIKLLSSHRKLEIQSCDSMERLFCPNSIESLVISDCNSTRHVCFSKATTTGGGGQNLKSLTILGSDMHMEIINNTSMPMLKVINIDGWKNLKSINQLSNCIHLTYLSMQTCQSMESFADLELSSLTRLRIEGCESVESFPNLHLPNLTHLDIQSCKNMKAFGDLQLPNLIRWRIYNCENLESFPDLQLSNLTMLKDMSIRKCPMIDASFPRGLWPPKLISLEVGELKRPISEWGYQSFPASLVDLSLGGESHVRNFSQLSHLFPSSLTQLWIENFDKLESLSTGLQHLTALQHLSIWGCPQMIHLPETLLPSLLSLTIYKCPKLKERCEGGSHYWPLISHIPCIQIEDSYDSD